MKRAITTKQSLCSVWSIFFLFFALSCTQTDVVDDVRPVSGQDVETFFNLQVLASRPTKTRSITFKSDGTIDSDTLSVGINDSIRTKGTDPLSEAQESELSSLWVGQYDAATNLRLSSHYFSNQSGNTINLKLKVNAIGQTSRVYFVANTIDLGAVDENTLKVRTLTYGSTDAGLPDNNRCMMMGIWNGAVPSNGLQNINVELTRLIAKISFTYVIGGTDFSFTPSSITLKNAPTLSRVTAPTTQLADAGMSYKDYTTTNPPSTTKTFYWYLPENMAGTVSGNNVVTSEKKKIGKGVTNATCIELQGDAVQDGVSYNDVVIRFFPGGGMNNYDIVRNAHYQMNVTLVGLDVSDERITVGKVPSVVVDQTKMLAEKGSEKFVQIPARPGVAWQLKLPTWLSALVDGKKAPANSTINYDGPVLMTFQAATANPKAVDRTEKMNLVVNGTSQTFQLIQEGSKLQLNNNIALDATGVTASSATFTATKGLPWQASPNVDWIRWATGNKATGGEATGGEQTLLVKADGVNRFATSREGRIILKAGASITDPSYTTLSKEIAVVQAGSEITNCTVFRKVAAEGQTTPYLRGQFKSTPGLTWTSNIGAYSWIHIMSGGSGSSTTGALQDIDFCVDVNPNSTSRNGDIMVQAGDPTNGPKGRIVVNQLGSSFVLVSSSIVGLNFNSQTFQVTVKGTKGLKWEVTPRDAQQIVPEYFNGDLAGQNQNIKFTAFENFGPPRIKTFCFAVSGGDHRNTVTVKQTANPILTINQEILTKYVTHSVMYGGLDVNPPFDIDGDGGQKIKSMHPGVSFNLTGMPTMTGSYRLQVEGTQKTGYDSYINMKNYCRDLREGGYTNWRLPTLIELYVIWDKAKGDDGNAADEDPDSQLYGSALVGYTFWSSSVFSTTPDKRCIQDLTNGSFTWYVMTNNSGYVRCVRDL